MKEELTRLQVLKSYLILDSEREEAFERITALASRIFDVPIALVSLVDLGRQWFMSNRGLGDARETPRKYAFCAHAILNKSKILVVTDARLDFRFRENPLVTGPPHIRFYAGAYTIDSPRRFLHVLLYLLTLLILVFSLAKELHLKVLKATNSELFALFLLILDQTD